MPRHIELCPKLFVHVVDPLVVDKIDVEAAGYQPHKETQHTQTKKSTQARWTPSPCLAQGPEDHQASESTCMTLASVCANSAWTPGFLNSRGDHFFMMGSSTISSFSSS